MKKCYECGKKMKAVSTDGNCMKCFKCGVIFISATGMEISTTGWKLDKDFKRSTQQSEGKDGEKV